MISNKLKRIFIATFSALICFTLLAPQSVFANNVEQKKQQTREKIKRIQLLEGLERNKLYKNQQK